MQFSTQYLVDYIRDFMNNKLKFRLRQDLSSFEIFQEFVNTCIVENKPLTEVNGKELNKVMNCIKKSVNDELRKFEDYLHECITIYYRNRNFEDFKSCLLTKVNNQKIKKVIEVCSENLPENEKLPFSLAMCVYSGLEAFYTAIHRVHNELKKIVKK